MDSFDALKRLLLQLKNQGEMPKPNADQRRAKVDATIAKLRAIEKSVEPKDQ